MNDLTYLRLILTEENNYPVMYSKQEEEVNIIGQDDQAMTPDDFKAIIKFFADRGLKKIKFVGGEPLLYRHLEDLVAYAHDCGVADIGITTNGIGLGTRILNLKNLGLNSVNISLDSLKEYRYQALTNGGNLKEVYLSIDACQAANVDVRINCVAIKDFNDDELVDFMRLTINSKLDVRLIELLPYNISRSVYERGYMDLQHYIENTEAINRSADEDLSVAQYFQIDGAQGRVGIIRAGSREYEEDLRRINISNRGYMNVGPLQKNTYFIKPKLRDEEALDNIFYKIKTKL
ncbi:molybdenum cofactor biosynthesis protein [Peptostreptococcus sp. MV1]|uniref:radical SAM protein n=1 Tax=Peptostreptococcus sp. MV1 TaxID=1219626 RepID=UPI00050EDD5F|nr:radical SAM protein [Peptostreptococcus sp. MV1]KGF12170.1 molybdenum cofactor biosynthesis protein [Peptostreptococcus sp. MV1]